MLTVSEAATNAVVHGNKLDPSKKATITAEADEKVLTIITTDEGSGLCLRKSQIRWQKRIYSKLRGAECF